MLACKWSITCSYWYICKTILCAPLEKRTESLFSNISYFFIRILISMISSGISQSGKYWQENWEYHLDMLEPFFCGHLFKTHISRRPQPYSISELQDTVNLILILLWVLILTSSATQTPFSTWQQLTVLVFSFILITYKLKYQPFQQEKMEHKAERGIVFHS